jgi:hypothetical protein
MTDQQLRDLLEERVAEVTMRDLSGVAWQQGRQARRRDRLAALGAAAVAMVAVTVGVAVLTDGGRSTQPAPAPGVPTTTPLPADTPDTTYQDVPVWWSLGQDQEVNLPRAESSPLPALIDLGSGPLVEAIDRAVAAFSVGDEVRLVDAQGRQMAVPLDRLDDLVKPNGYGYRPVHHSMLSPAGDYLVFPQNDSVAVYTVATGEWRSIDTGDRVTRFVVWVGDEAFALPSAPGEGGDSFTVDGEPALPADLQVAVEVQRPGFGTGEAQAFGPTRTTSGGSRAQSWGMGVPIPVADAGNYLSDPEFIAASVGGTTSVLAVMWDIRDQGHDGRFLQCCPVAGWLDDRTLVYESRQTNPALVAWTVGTDDFGLVSRIEGQYVLASFARLDGSAGAS